MNTVVFYYNGYSNVGRMLETQHTKKCEKKCNGYTCSSCPTNTFEPYTRGHTNHEFKKGTLISHVEIYRENDADTGSAVVVLKGMETLGVVSRISFLGMYTKEDVYCRLVEDTTIQVIVESGTLIKPIVVIYFEEVSPEGNILVDSQPETIIDTLRRIESKIDDRNHEVVWPNFESFYNMKIDRICFDEIGWDTLHEIAKDCFEMGFREGFQKGKNK